MSNGGSEADALLVEGATFVMAGHSYAIVSVGEKAIRYARQNPGWMATYYTTTRSAFTAVAAAGLISSNQSRL